MATPDRTDRPVQRLLFDPQPKPKRRPWKPTDGQTSEVIRRYETGDPTTAIAGDFGVLPSTVWRLLKRWGVPIRSMSDASRRYPLDESVFDVVTEESAYWIGFLMADGCVTRRRGSGQTCVTLSLAEEDAGHVMKFQQFLGTTLPIKVCDNRKPTSPNAQPLHSLSVTSPRLADRLAAFGVVPRKSHTAEVIGLEDDRHFHRGLVDGDGGLTFTKPPKDAVNPFPSFTLVGSRTIVGQFSAFVARHLGFTLNPRPVNSAWGVLATCRQAARIAALLYDGATVALDRKYAAAQEFAAYLTRRLEVGRRTCSVAGCGRRHGAKGLCRHHYQQQRDQKRREETSARRAAEPPILCSTPGCERRSGQEGLCRPCWTAAWWARKRQQG